MIDVTLMGCGRWGARLLAALAQHPGYRVVAVVDPDPQARARAASIVPSVANTLQGEAVFVATPSPLHAEHALAALEADMDVFVEKPLCFTRAEADRLCDRVAARGRIGMAGHVLRYHPAVCRFVARVRAGEVGVVERVVARRFTQSGSPDPLWTLACHDVATLFAMDASDVVDVARNGHNGMVALSLGLSSGVEARIEVSTKAAEPQRRTEVFGSAGTLCLDELATEADALRYELDHFASCVRERVEPRTSFADARSVVATLERADEALA